MLEKYLKQTQFTDFEDFKANYQLLVPENFNFAYDIVDEWAAKEPDKQALLWTNDNGEYRKFTFAEIKKWFKSYSTTEEFQVEFEENDDFVDITVISKMVGNEDIEKKLKLLKDFRTLSHFIAKSIKDK